MIISGGLNISPAEIEAVINQIPGVEEVAVISVPDAKFGETPAALVRTTTEMKESEVVGFCNERLADYKVPRYIVFMDEPLPRMPSGKIAKRQLRDAFADVPDNYDKVR
jgi:fatty-acyl-CoA synthase